MKIDRSLAHVLYRPIENKTYKRMTRKPTINE